MIDIRLEKRYLVLYIAVDRGFSLFGIGKKKTPFLPKAIVVNGGGEKNARDAP